MGDDRERVLRLAVDRFNVGDLEGVLELFDPMVEWPDLMDDKLIWGHRAVRDYWERQLLVALPQVTPLEFVPVGDDMVMIARQQVQDRATAEDLIPTTVIAQRYSFRDGLVTRMRLFRSLDEARAAEDTS